jgi:hypothetical protein
VSDNRNTRAASEKSGAKQKQNENCKFPIQTSCRRF